MCKPVLMYRKHASITRFLCMLLSLEGLLVTTTSLPLHGLLASQRSFEMVVSAQLMFYSHRYIFFSDIWFWNFFRNSCIYKYTTCFTLFHNTILQIKVCQNALKRFGCNSWMGETIRKPHVSTEGWYNIKNYLWETDSVGV